MGVCTKNPYIYKIDLIIYYFLSLSFNVSLLQMDLIE